MTTSWREQNIFRRDDIRFLLDQHAKYDFCHKATVHVRRHVATLGHILIPSQPVFTLIWDVLSREATHINFIVFGVIRSELEPTIYNTRGKHANYYIHFGLKIMNQYLTLSDTQVTK